MSANQQPSRYAPASPGDRIERNLLASLSFVGRKQAEFCLDAAHSIELVRSELNRVFATDGMAELNAAIIAGPQATAPRAEARQHRANFVADAQAAQALAEQREFMDQKMQVGAYAPDAARSTAFDAHTGIQTFGVGVAH
jgi:hypothetical protein